MKKRAKNFKSASIEYMAKGNSILKNELDAIAASATIDGKVINTRTIPSSFKSIKSKLEGLADWFNGEQILRNKSNNVSNNQSPIAVRVDDSYDIEK